MSNKRVRWGLWAATLLLFAVGRSVSAQTIANGGFESNGGTGFSDFTGWTTADEANSAGAFYVQTGTGTPLFGNLVPSPPEGDFAAMTDAGGAGAHVLYQDFAVPTGAIGTTDLSFQLFFNNQAGDYVTPASLDFTAGDNQQARVDILLASADPFSVASGDVLLNLYQTHSGNALTSGYTLVSIDITSLLQAHTGETLRLRFSEVDNLNTFNFGVDDVRLNGTAVPEPGALALLAGGLLAGMGTCAGRRRSRHR